MGKFLMSYSTGIATCIWLLVGLVRSLKYLHKEAQKKPLLCEDYNNLTSQTSNQIPDIHITVSVVYGTFFRNYFSCMCVHIVQSFILTVR